MAGRAEVIAKGSCYLSSVVVRVTDLLPLLDIVDEFVVFMKDDSVSIPDKLIELNQYIRVRSLPHCSHLTEKLMLYIPIIEISAGQYGSSRTEI